MEGWKGGRVGNGNANAAKRKQVQPQGERERKGATHTRARARAKVFTRISRYYTKKRVGRGGGVAAYSDGALDGFEVNVGGKHGVHDAQQRAYELVVAHVAGSDRVEQCRQHKLHSKSQQEDVIRACVCL